MKIEIVPREWFPNGHTWAVVEHDGEVTVLAVDGFAARIARLAYSKASK